MTEDLSVSAALIVSMFESLQKGQNATLIRLEEGNERMTLIESRLGGVELRLKEQNGNVAKLSSWQRLHDWEAEKSQIAAEAIAGEKARIVGNVHRVKDVISEWSVPVLLVGGGLVTLTNVALALFWWLR